MPSAEHCDRLVLNQASLPKARQWLEWLAYHLDRLPDAAGWQRGLRDALLELHHCIAISARRLRGNPIWDFQGTLVTDTEPLEARAQRLLKTFEGINDKDIPERFQDLKLCLYGGIRQMIRLAREIDLMREMGHITVDVLLDQKTVTLTEQ